jgi:hypothetical protein
MPYDQSLDKQVFCKTWETDDVRISVSVYSYNGGQKKLQISRENKNADGELRFAKLGRLTKEEAEAILPLIQLAIPQLDPTPAL